jgi:transposase, IS5 family
MHREDVNRRPSKRKFFQQINKLVDWSRIEKELYKICKRSIQDAASRHSCNPLILFKMMLLQTWYNLSDIEVEDMVNENLAANAFCGLRVEGTVPDHSTLSRFRSELSEKRALHRLLTKLNAQLELRGVLVQQGGGIKEGGNEQTEHLESPPSEPLGPCVLFMESPRYWVYAIFLIRS